MKLLRSSLALVVLTGLAACKPGASHEATATPSPTATPTPEPGFAGSAGVSESTPAPAAPAATPDEAPVEVKAPEQVNTDANNEENQLVKAEVLSRIDVMPKLSPEEKDKLYVQVERARGMGKVITIPFSSGKTALGSADIGALKQTIALPQLQKFAEDPTVVFVVLGYADKKGDAQKNLAISLTRADSVVNALKQNCGVMNVVHAVGMGSSEMFDAKNLDKNRVVEVWAVLP